MSQSKTTPTTFLTRVLQDFCIPTVLGLPPGQEPEQAAVLTESQRLQAGITKPGKTYVYPAAGAAVFLDLNTDRAQVWFVHEEAKDALEKVQRSLMQTNRGLKQIDDIVSPSEANRRERIFAGELTGDRAIQIELSYPVPERSGATKNNLFIARVIGLQIQDRAQFEKMMKKAKG